MKINHELERSVRAEIDRAKVMHNDIKHLSPQELKLDSDVKQVVGTFLTLALEHHGAILVLLEHGGGFDGSDFTLMRPVVEAVYRGHWIQCCASSENVARVRNGESPIQVSRTWQLL